MPLSVPGSPLQAPYLPLGFPENRWSTSAAAAFLGWRLKGRSRQARVHLGLEDVKRHVSILGATGSGKTTTAATLALRLWRIGCQVLVLDWHNEYRGLAEAVGGKVIPLALPGSPSINPLDPRLCSDIFTHADVVTDIFSEVFSFSAPQTYTFFTALLDEYEARGYLRGELNAESPTLVEVLERIRSSPMRSRFDYEIKVALERRLLPITAGQAGAAMNGHPQVDVEDILKGFTVVELGHIRSYSSRCMLLSVLLKLIDDWCTKREKASLPHITVLEEAHNVIPPRRIETPPSIGERMVGELRKFGEALIIVSQLPTQISQEIIKNSAVRICHSLRTMDDQRVVGGALGLKGERVNILRALRPGEAILDVSGMLEPCVVYVEPSSIQERRSGER